MNTDCPCDSCVAIMAMARKVNERGLTTAGVLEAAARRVAARGGPRNPEVRAALEKLNRPKLTLIKGGAL